MITGSLRSQGQAVTTGADVRLVGGQLEREFDLLTTGNIDSQGSVEVGVRGFDRQRYHFPFQRHPAGARLRGWRCHRER